MDSLFDGSRFFDGQRIDWLFSGGDGQRLAVGQILNTHADLFIRNLEILITEIESMPDGRTLVRTLVRARSG